MARTDPFSPEVAARTRTARALLSNPALLSAYEAAGGLREDLDAIVTTGVQAEAANQGQSVAGAAGEAATVEVWSGFDALKTEYNAVMSVVQATAGDLRRAKAPAETIVAIETILENEAPVRIIATALGQRRTRRVRSQETIRAEIQKDATSLLALQPAHDALARRKVDTTRLQKLEQSAVSFTGKLGERTTKKGASKAATAAEREAVKAQKEVWSSVYRLLDAVASTDPGLQLLLKEAAGK